jgi:hypothetical protein
MDSIFTPITSERLVSLRASLLKCSYSVSSSGEQLTHLHKIMTLPNVSLTLSNGKLLFTGSTGSTEEFIHGTRLLLDRLLLQESSPYLQVGTGLLKQAEIIKEN